MNSRDYPNTLKKVAILLRSRMELIFVWTWATVVSCLIAGKGFPPIKPTLMLISAMFFLSSAVYLYNDIIDKEMDSMNPTKKNRPLISGTVSVKNAMRIIYLFGFIGLALTLFIDIYSFLFTLLWLILLSSYSYPKIRLKTKYLGKELTLFFGWILLGLTCSYAIIGNLYIPLLFSTILFGIWTFTNLPIIGDAGDIEEDRLYKAKNISVILGWRRKIQLLLFGILFIMTVTPLTYVRFDFNIMLPILTVALSSIFLSLIYPKIVLFEKNEHLAREREYPKIRRIGYIYILLLEIIFIFGSINLNLFI